jgi:uncharacterized damage-inducible protein DinB
VVQPVAYMLRGWRAGARPEARFAMPTPTRRAEMNTNEARELFGYGSWAIARMFSSTEALSAEQLEAPATSSFPSASATLGHIIEADWIWMRRWLGHSPTSAPIWHGRSSLTELKVQCAAVEGERRAIVCGRRGATPRRPKTWPRDGDTPAERAI